MLVIKELTKRKDTERKEKKIIIQIEVQVDYVLEVEKKNQKIICIRKVKRYKKRD